VLGCSINSLFGLSPFDPSKDSFLLYKKVTEQYRNPEILRIVRSLIPQDIVLQTRGLCTWLQDKRCLLPGKEPLLM
jgi:hypothetical protein